MNSTSSRDQRILEAKRTEQPEIQEGGPRKKKRGGEKEKLRVQRGKDMKCAYESGRMNEHVETEAIEEHTSGTTGETEATEEVVDAMDVDEETAVTEREFNMLEGLPQSTRTASSVLAQSQHFLPSWLASPTLISSQITQSPASVITSLNLHPAILKNLATNGITHFFPVQLATLSLLLPTQSSTVSVRDIFIRAQTGSGKTLAYILPIIQSLLPRVIPRIRALILLPTRDLSLQVKHEFDLYTSHTSLKTVLLGSQSLSAEVAQLEKGCDVLVTTPGRLCEHVKGKNVDLRHVRFLVVDEADRLLNQTYQRWLEVVLDATKETRETVEGKERTSRIKGHGHGTPLQKLLFSATLTQNPLKISNLDLNEPVYICVDTASTQPAHKQSESLQSKQSDSKQEQPKALIVLPETLQEEMFITTQKMKLAALTFVLRQSQGENVVVFVKSVGSAHRLSAFLNIHLPKHFTTLPRQHDQTEEQGQHPLTQAVTSQLSPSQRTQTLRQFGHTFHILIATDLLSRGIDIPIALVIHYDQPLRVETYVHRCGRTARAGKEGRAVCLVEKKGVRHLKEVQRGCGRKGKVLKRGMGSALKENDDETGGEGRHGGKRDGEYVEECAEGLEDSLRELQSLVTGESVNYDQQDQEDSHQTYGEYDEYTY